MNGSRVNKMAAGFLVMLAGLFMLLDNLGFHLRLSHLLPLVVLYAAVRLWTRGRRLWAAILFVLGAQWALNTWFGIEVGREVLVSIGLVYLGYRLVRGTRRLPHDGETDSVDWRDWARSKKAWKKAWKSAWKEMWKGHWAPPHGTAPFDIPFSGSRYSPPPPGYPPHAPVFSPGGSRSALIGDFYLTSGRFELSHLHVWQGVGDVVIDLSRAVLSEEETYLVINGWVGDVTLYVPVDLPVSVTAAVTVGDIEVFGHRQGGLNRQVSLQSPQYEAASRKVRLIVSLFVGDIDVKYI